VLGKLHYLEVHNLEVIDQSVEDNPLTAEDRQSLAVTLKRRS
jgi:hypothetical protein